MITEQQKQKYSAKLMEKHFYIGYILHVIFEDDPFYMVMIFILFIAVLFLILTPIIFYILK